MRKIWHNGKIKDETEAKVSVYDSAMMFGDTVFEMTRSFQKKHFKLREHLERLQMSMRYIRLDCGMNINELEKACKKIAEINEDVFAKDDEHRLMINVTRGPLSIYGNVNGVTKGPNIIITDFPLKWTVSGFGKLYNEGINAVITSQRAIPSRYLDPKIKHRSRLYLQMANIEASNHKGRNNWALLLDEDGFVAEGTGDNFFIIKDQVLYTPEGRNILRGISRQYIFDLCNTHNLECKERNIEPYDVLNADEAFMTGTPFCILPVSSLNGIGIGEGIGILTRTLLQWWGQSVGVDIENQIKTWDECNTITGGFSPYNFGVENE